MSLIKKTVFNMTKVGDDDLGLILDKCLTHLGTKLYEADQERISSGKDTDNSTEVYEQDYLIFNVQNGKEISLNTQCIYFESDMFITENEAALNKVAVHYMLNEIGKVVASRIKEYENFIKKLLIANNCQKFELKIIQLGTTQYFFYTI